MTTTQTTNDMIPALWFDKLGCGPSDLAIQLHPFPAERDGKIPASLGLRIRGAPPRAGARIIYGAADELVDSGFNLERAQVEQLHRQIGNWLDATAKLPDKNQVTELAALCLRISEWEDGDADNDANRICVRCDETVHLDPAELTRSPLCNACAQAVAGDAAAIVPLILANQRILETGTWMARLMEMPRPDVTAAVMRDLAHDPTIPPPTISPMRNDPPRQADSGAAGVPSFWDNAKHQYQVMTLPPELITAIDNYLDIDDDTTANSIARLIEAARIGEWIAGLRVMRRGRTTDDALESLSTPLIPVKKDDNSVVYHMDGVVGDNGQSPGVLAVCGMLDPSPDFPGSVRIILGAPRKSPFMEGYIPKIDGWAMSVDVADRLIVHLQQIIRDVNAATASTVLGTAT